MKASFRITHPNMLAEAQAGDLFVPLGPDLVECVCALRCRPALNKGAEADTPFAARFNPDASLPLVVIACRVGQGEPEFYPPGYTTVLSGAAPIQFLDQCSALQLQPRIERQDTVTDAAETAATEPLYADLDAMQLDMDHINLVTRVHLDSIRRLRHRAATAPTLPEHASRPELASRL